VTVNTSPAGRGKPMTAELIEKIRVPISDVVFRPGSKKRPPTLSMYQTTDQESKKQIGLKSSPDPIPTNSATRINVLYIYINTMYFLLKFDVIFKLK